MSDDIDPQDQDPETVRIIGAEEAEEALERDDVARRRGADEPRPGDRPDAPPADRPEPRLRFPLGSESVETADAGSLPHWTEPPTGQHDFGGNIFDEAGSVGDDWAAASAAPRWRGQGDDFDDDVRAFAGDEEGVTAAEDRPDPEDFFRFDDIDPSGSRSVFGDVEDDYADDDFDDDTLGPAAVGPRKIVVGGGRVAPTGPALASRSGVGGDRDLGQAAIVGVGFLVVAIALFAAGPPFAALLVAGVVTAAVAEFYTKVQEVGYRPPTLIGVVATAGIIVGTYNRGEAAIPVVLVLTVGFALLWYLAGAGEGQAVVNIGVTLLGVGWIGLCGSFAAALLAVQGGPGVGDAGKGILFGAILATVGYDVGGYFVGRSAGRSPLSEASPNKTVEGLVGGCIAALIVAIIYGLLSQPLGSLGDSIRLGVAVAVAAPLGDLCQSMIKRDLGIKDMGSMLPGHGGLLDRFDALLFVLPTVYYVAKLSDFFL